MSPNFLVVALFAAFLVGGVLDAIAPLWAVVLIGAALAVAAFVVMDRYPSVRGNHDARRSPPRHPPAGSGTSRASHRLAAGARGGWVHQQACLTGAS